MCWRALHGLHVRRRVFFEKWIDNGHENTLLSFTMQVSLLTHVRRLRGATR